MHKKQEVYPVHIISTAEKLLLIFVQNQFFKFIYLFCTWIYCTKYNIRIHKFNNCAQNVVHKFFLSILYPQLYAHKNRAHNDCAQKKITVNFCAKINFLSSYIYFAHEFLVQNIILGFINLIIVHKFFFPYIFSTCAIKIHVRNCMHNY